MSLLIVDINLKVISSIRKLFYSPDNPWYSGVCLTAVTWILSGNKQLQKEPEINGIKISGPDPWLHVFNWKYGKKKPVGFNACQGNPQICKLPKTPKKSRHLNSLIGTVSHSKASYFPCKRTFIIRKFKFWKTTGFHLPVLAQLCHMKIEVAGILIQTNMGLNWHQDTVPAA